MPYCLYHLSGVVGFWKEQAPLRNLFVLRRTVARRDNDIHLGSSSLHRSSEFQTIYGARQVDIGDEKLNVFMIVKQLRRFVGTRRRENLITGLLKNEFQMFIGEDIIFHDHNCGHSRSPPGTQRGARAIGEWI